MTTIPRNHKKKIAAIAQTVKFCQVYDSASGNMKTAEIGWAFRALDTFHSARLRVEEDGEKWVISVHSNLWYELTVRDPEEIKAERKAAAEARAARLRAEREAAPVATTPHRSATGRRLSPGAENMQGAAEGSVSALLSSGILKRDAMTGRLPMMSAAIIAKTVRTKLDQGWSHDEIRALLKRRKAQEAAKGDTVRGRLWDTFIDVHEGIVKDLQARGGQLAALGSAGTEGTESAGAPVVAQVLAEVREAPARPKVSPSPYTLAPVDPAPVEVLPTKTAAPELRGRKLPPHEESYTPAAGAKPYAVRRARAALEAAGVPVKGDDEEFWLIIGEKASDRLTVSVMALGGSPANAIPRSGPKRDRWEARRARVLLALVEGGFRDVGLTQGGVIASPPRPRKAATVVLVSGQRAYLDKTIDQAVSLPQYPQVTGWVLRRQWGERYMGPAHPWMENLETGVTLHEGIKDERAACAALVRHYGLWEPLEVWEG